MNDISRFVSKCVIKRDKSMFIHDLELNKIKIEQGIRGKSVLVIGGAGSIGSSFIKELLRFSPDSLIIVDTNENSLAELTRDLRCSIGITIPNEYKPYAMDYRTSVFEKMFKDHGGFDIVANFSAHKHVRSEKDVYSVEALLKNNVLDAVRLMELLKDYPPECYFCVSTDKAANPVNIMGASKRVMEDMIFSYSECFPIKTARFANVAFSNGSLPDGFLHRIMKMQPISAPSDVKRYFVSMEESGQICLMSCILGANREIFFPKLNDAQMMSFDQIARDLLNENGYIVYECNSENEALNKSEGLRKGDREYPVFFSRSDTSGEKTYEEFYTDKEEIDMDRFESMGVIVNKSIPDNNRLIEFMDKLTKTFSNDDYSKSDIVKVIQGYLDGFEHIETGKGLDQKM